LISTGMRFVLKKGKNKKKGKGGQD